MVYGTWMSLLPPIIAIILALVTKQAYLALFVGVTTGAFFMAGPHPWAAFETLLDTMISNVDLTIIIFLILISIVVRLMQMSGGTYAYGEWAYRNLKNKKSSLIATSLLGMLIFMDDGFNCLTVGSVMMPVTDKFKVSRAKLAYIIDATAAPVCILAPISSWAAAINSYIPEGYTINGFSMFVKAIPFNFYAILTLVMVFGTSIAGFDFGLMKKYERAVESGKPDLSAGKRSSESADSKGMKGSVIDLVLPMVFLIVLAIAAMIYTGYLNGGRTVIECFANCESAKSLVFASLMTILFCAGLYLPRKVMSFKDYMDCIPTGSTLMVPFMIILVLAWTLKGMISGLGADVFINSLMQGASSAYALIPIFLFIVSVFVSFSSGTSWGTFAIMIPITVAMLSADQQMLLIGIAACLAGGVTGDHISPISDTTIMSSTGAGSNHIDHVSSQIQYQIPVIIASAIGYIIAGFTKSFVVALPASVVILALEVYLIYRVSGKKE
ncbi:MAG: Na+/H+ antiporter NhaC family protein [Butyrivibrio sp.]|uniref:Na+/H+ antiporter NhaC family protein n=1 Tax=Butyrivibrio sp. TaxID=28121 RepID=UPI0025DD8C44|nr:Na+/H+ antiporter NhaC family protein [Butyrivibrio sp.]MCR5770454.1 Na+/H+ antiporter NhaC family protein [Butyrivibrio sp.]